MSERWICGICGYVSSGAAPPDVCPACGAPFTAFERRERNPRAKFRKIEIVDKRPAGFRYVIVGNSAAGRSAVKALQALDPSGQITVISEEDVAFYSRPTLPDFIGGMSRDDFFAIGEAYPENGFEIIAGEVAVELDAAAKTVTCASGRKVPYDALLLATGSNPVQVPWPGSDAEGIAYFRTFADAERICRQAREGARAVVIGGGLLGLEFVRAFHARGLSITQLIRERRVGAPALDEQAGAIVQLALEDWGVDLALEEETDSFEACDGKVCGVKTSKGRTIECDLVGVAIGARPRIDVAQQAGLETDRGIIVDSRFRSSDPSIYAAGDCAQAYDQVWGENRVTTSWRNSQEQGEFAGVCMAGGAGEYAGAVAVNFQLAAGLPFCAIGISNPVDPENYDIETAADESKRQYRKLVRKDGRLVGAALVGDLSEARDLEQQVRADAAPAVADSGSRPVQPAAPVTTTGPDTVAVSETISVEAKSEMHDMTKQNVEGAFAGESQAHIKYLNFAQKADEEGKGNVARLFRAASFAEQVHATRHLEVLDGIGATGDNLAEARGGETFEVEEMYPAYMAVADEQEEDDANRSFNYAFQAEKQHQAFYIRAKQAVDAGGDANFDAIHVCGYCGCTLEGDAPDKCPVCGAPKKDFIKF